MSRMLWATAAAVVLGTPWQDGGETRPSGRGDSRMPPGRYPSVLPAGSRSACRSVLPAGTGSAGRTVSPAVRSDPAAADHHRPVVPTDSGSANAWTPADPLARAPEAGTLSPATFNANMFGDSFSGGQIAFSQSCPGPRRLS